MSTENRSPVAKATGYAARLARRAPNRVRRANDMVYLARVFDGEIGELTKVGGRSLLGLISQVRTVLAEDIPGDIVECGVWRGGASLMMADQLERAGERSRRVWLCDSFEGLPPPDAADGNDAHEWWDETSEAGRDQVCVADLHDVEGSAKRFGLEHRVEFVKGWFDQTLPAARKRIGPISLLRVDADWHASVLTCLEQLYDQVSPGGFIIFDDYDAFEGCAVAVHEFLGSRHLGHRIHHDGCAYLRKI